MVARRLIFGNDAQARLMRGVDALADAVGVTLGPAGGHVLIGRPGKAPRITRDGATVADALELGDRVADLGLQMIRRAAATAAEQAGDGSTTATVIAQAMARDGLKMVAAGANPMDLKRGIDQAVASVLATLGTRARQVTRSEDIARVGAIAANSDETIGRLVARAMARAGADGVVSVEGGNSLATVLDHVRGMRFEQGYVSPYFMTDAETTRCELRNPYVLVCEARIEHHEPLLKLLEASVRAQKPLLIIAEDITGDALQTLVTSKVKGGLRVAASKAPLFGDRRAAVMDDIAVVTGGRLISERKGETLARAGPEVLGRARRAVLTPSDTTIIDGRGEPRALARRCDEIRHRIPEAVSDYDRDYLRKRLARLSGGVAVIRAGGATEAEIGERAQRIESAVNAVRAAAAEGILSGGGAALFHAAARLADLEAPSADHAYGIAIVRRAIQAPLRRIVENADGDAAAVAANLQASGDPDTGYDARSGQCRNMVDAGVLDAAKVVRTALAAAASVAGLLITIGAVVARLPEPPPRPLDQRPFGPESPDMLPEDLDRYGLR